MRRWVLALTLAAAGATAREHPWMARFQAGSSTIHEWGRSGVWAKLALGARSSAACSPPTWAWPSPARTRGTAP